MNQPDNSLVPVRREAREDTHIVTILRLTQQLCPDCTHHYTCAVVQFDGCPDRRVLCWNCIHRFCAVINSLRTRL